MRADVTLRLGPVRIPGEITTEHPLAPGEAVFVPWRHETRWVVDRPYLLDRRAAVIVPRCGRQVSRLVAAVVTWPQVRVADAEPWPRRGEHKLVVTTSRDVVGRVRRLARRDGVAVAAFVRSAVLRELTRRGWRETAQESKGTIA